MRYTVLLELDDEVGMYVVSVPTLPGCFTQGATVEQALERAREAITGHVAALADLGEPIPVETTPPLLTSVEIEAAA
jgi:predicted RNase H-like HicB family nuclease